MNEAKRIFSNKRRLLAVLALPVLCLILFFYQKNREEIAFSIDVYRETLQQAQGRSPEEFAAALESAWDGDYSQGKVLEQVQYLAEYPEYLTRVQEQAERLQKSSLFGSDPNTFTYRNILKTAKDFQGVTADGVRLGNDWALRYWLSFKTADWIFLGAILLLVMSFLEERKKGLSAIIRACPGGRGKLQLSRLGILLCYSAVMAVLLYALPLGVAFAIDGGYEDLARPVQSMVEFQKCTVKLTIAQFLGWYFVVKTACGFLLGVLFWFGLSFLQRPQMGWLITTAAMAAEYLLYILIPAQSIFSPLREINVFSYVFSASLFTQYSNINFLGFPVGRRTFLLYLLGIVAATLSVVTVWVLARRFPFGNRDLLGKWIHRWNCLWDGLRRHLGLYGFEVYKLLLLGAGGLFLIFGFLMTKDLPYATSAYMTSDDHLYLQYLNEVTGPVTEDTYDYLRRAREAIAEADMDTAPFTMAVDRLERTIESLPEGAWLVEEQRFMNCYGSRSTKVQRENGLYALIFLAACLSPLYASEQSGDVRKILRSTPRGRERLFWTKYALAMTLVLIVWFRVFCQEWSRTTHYMGDLILQAPNSSIAMLRSFPSMSVGGALMILYVYKLICLMIPANLCVFIGERCKGFEKAFLFSGLFLLLPAAAFYFGADWAGYLTPAGLVADYAYLYKPAFLLLFALWAVLSVAALLAAKRNWCKTH